MRLEAVRTLALAVIVGSCAKAARHEPPSIPLETPTDSPIAESHVEREREREREREPERKREREREPEPVVVPDLVDDDRKASTCADKDPCPLRARLRSYEPLYLAATGEGVIAETGRDVNWLDRPTVVARPSDEHERVEITCSTTDWWVSAFVEQRAFGQVVVESLRAATRAARVRRSEREGLYLSAGTPVAVADSEGGAVQITVLDDIGLGGLGWVRASAVGPMYEPSDRVPWSYPSEGRKTVEWEFLTLDMRPGGESFAKLSGVVEVLELGPRKRGQVLIAAGPRLDGDSHVVGWIEQDAFSHARTVEGSPRRIPGGVPAGLQQTVAALEPGAILSVDGHVVGGVLRPTEIVCARGCDTPTPKVLVGCGAIWTVQVYPPPTEAVAAPE